MKESTIAVAVTAGMALLSVVALLWHYLKPRGLVERANAPRNKLGMTSASDDTTASKLSLEQLEQERRDEEFLQTLEDILHTKKLSSPGDDRDTFSLDAPTLRRLVGAIVALVDSGLPRPALAKLLGVELEVIESAVGVFGLHLDDEKTMPLPDPAFREFLVDRQPYVDSRPWTDKNQAHKDLAADCLKVMSTHLKKDICGLRSPGASASDVDVLIMGKLLPPELRYACLNWVEHLRRSKWTAPNPGHENPVYDFLQCHLLHWLEVLSLLGHLSQGVQMMVALESMLQVKSEAEGGTLLIELVSDAQRYILKNRFAFETAPLQIYATGLVFSPANSAIRGLFLRHEDGPRWITRLPAPQDHWDPWVQAFEGHSGFIWAVAFSLDGLLLASASDDYTIRLWDVKTGASYGALTGHTDWVNYVAFSPDGKLLASASSDETMRLWDVNLQLQRGSPPTPSTRGQPLKLFEGSPYQFRNITFSPDSKILAAASTDRTIKLWSIKSNKTITLKGHLDSVMALRFSPDGASLFSVSWGRDVRLFNVHTGACCCTLQLPVFKPYDDISTLFTFSPDCQLIAEAASLNNTILVWDVSSLKPKRWVWEVNSLKAERKVPVTQKLQLKGHPSEVKALDFSPDGQLLASASKDGTIRLWSMAMSASRDQAGLDSTTKSNTDTKPLFRILKSHWHPVCAVAFSPDGELVASGAQDSSVRLSRTSINDGGRDDTAAIMEAEANNYSKSITAVAISPDGELVAAGSRGCRVTLWAFLTGDLLSSTLAGRSINSVAFSPDSKIVASGLFGGSIKLWEANNTAMPCLAVLHGAEDTTRVTAVAFSPNGEMLASTSEDRIIRIFDIQTRANIRSIEVKGIPQHIVFSPDGSVVKVNISIHHHTAVEYVTLDLPTCHGYESSDENLSTLWVDGIWVTCDEKKVLWLPPDNRPQSVASWKNRLAIGHVTGRISFIEFDPAFLKEQV